MPTPDKPYIPEVIIYPFHQRSVYDDDLYHVRCSRHPEFAAGKCGTITEAGTWVEEHLNDHINEAEATVGG